MLPHKFKTSPINPALIMLAFWSVIYLTYLLGPIHLTPELSLNGFLFLALNLFLFTIGALVLVRIPSFAVAPQSKYRLGESAQFKLIFLLLSLGICGGLLSIYSKLSLLDTIDFISIARLRSVKAQNLLSASMVPINHLSAIAGLIYPAGFVGVVAALFSFEKTPRFVKVVCYLFMFILYPLAICAGGRSPLLVLFLFIGVTCYLRKKTGKKIIPKSMFLKVFLVVLSSIFIWYSNLVWQVRTKEAGLTTQAMLQHSAKVWGAEPRKTLVSISDLLHSPKLTQSILSTTFYFIQSVSTTERMLASEKKMPVLYGAYHIDIAAALLRSFPAGSLFLKQGYDQLMEASIYGYFTGAWSALFIDFGYLSPFFVLLWGYMAGRTWLSFRSTPNMLTASVYSFWIYATLISFVSPPWGFCNSFMIFFWFVMFSLASRLKLFERFNFMLVKSETRKLTADMRG